MSMVTTENKLEEKEVFEQPIKKWNRPTGLKYNKKPKKEKVKRPHGELCKCVSCSYKRLKENIAAPINKEEIIKEYIDNLPNDEILFVLSEKNLDAVISKLEILKQKFPVSNYREFINEVINESISFYTSTL